MGAKERGARSAPSTPRPTSRPEAKTRPTSPTPAIIGSCGFLGLRYSVFGIRCSARQRPIRLIGPIRPIPLPTPNTEYLSEGELFVNVNWRWHARFRGLLPLSPHALADDGRLFVVRLDELEARTYQILRIEPGGEPSPGAATSPP